MAGSIKVRDKGYDALLKRLTKRAGRVTVGIHEAEASEEHGEDGTTVGEVAAINELGFGVPERSFLRAWFDEHETDNAERMRRLTRAVIEGKLGSIEQALERFGLFAVGSIQDRIANGIDPPNAPATVKRKGSSTPLIDDGILRIKITHKVEK